MKLSLVLPLAVALVAGFVLGGVGPRRELAQTQLEVASLTERLSQRTPQPSPLSLLLPVPELQCPEPGAPGLELREQRLDGKQVASADAERETSVASGPDTGALAAEEGDGSEVAGRRARSREAQRAQIEVLRSAQQARTRQARAALQEQAGLSGREMDEVDGITRQMNSALASSTADLLALDRTPSSLEMLGAASKVSAILYQGQAALEGLVGPSISEVDRTARDIFNYIEIPPDLLELRMLDSDPGSPADDGPGGS